VANSRDPKFKPVQSLQRGLALLERLAGKPDGAALKDLAAHIGTSPAATYHLIHTLVEKGYAQRLEEPVRYVLGERWLAIASGQAGRLFTTAVHEEMLKIAGELPGASVHFSEYVGGSVVVTAHIAASLPGHIRDGGHHLLPPYASGGSLVHLAFWPDEIAAEYESRHPFDQYGLPYWRTRKAFEGALASMRNDRFFLMPEASPLHLKLAMPILRRGGALAAALTLQWNQKSEEAIPCARPKLIATALQSCASLQQRLS